MESIILYYQSIMPRTLTIVPCCGLANRMRAIAGAYVMATMSDRKLEILWPITRDLAAPIEVLLDTQSLRADWRDITSRQLTMHYKSPGPGNMYLSAVTRSFGAKIRGRYYLNPDRRAGRRASYADFEVIEHDIREKAMSPDIRHLVITTAQEIGYVPPEIFRSIFRPSALVRELVDGKEGLIGPALYRIGVHVRRTDNKDAIRLSPLRDIMAVVKSEIKRADRPSMIYLATDDEKVKKKFSREFPNVITSAQPATRSTVSGMLEATAEMWMLSRCNIIIGSAASAFNVMASRIGDRPLITVER